MDTVAILLNYNDADTTISAIKRLKNCESLDKIVVVDNASSDNSYERLKAYESEKVALIKAKENLGYGCGNNLGLCYAYKDLAASYALIANPDTFIEDRVISKLRKSFDKIKDLAAAAPVMKLKAKKALSFKESLLNLTLGFPCRSFIKELMECCPIIRRLFVNRLHYNKKHYKKNIAFVDAVAGSLLMVDIEKMIEVGGYDEGVFLYQEEAILGFKLKQRGYKTIILTKYSYLHAHSQSINKSFDKTLARQRLREESVLYYFKRYLRVGDLKIAFAKLVFFIIRLEISLFDILSKVCKM